jgi:hypothetical protein
MREKKEKKRKGSFNKEASLGEEAFPPFEKHPADKTRALSNHT